MKKAVFLDRDGTIVEEVEFLSKVKDMKVIEGAAEALSQLGEAGYLLIVVSNQSGVARGLFDDAVVERINVALAKELKASGAKVEMFLWCPHHPDFSGGCGCRKPSPGMILAAARELNVDLSASWTVGDKLSDIEAGRSAGTRTALVRTGYGKSVESSMKKKGVIPDGVFDDIGKFADALLGGAKD
ncbi:MAG: D,D-heptose 1,7-bisphosphate phosphatase [Deltaproteobacteria bacterium]|nr:MAG: D,D-heptose 1,7-bisphosphate phosphatase [Deltaproteobacteria bacterium]